MRDARDDLANRIETFVTTRFAGLWQAIQRFPALHARVSARLVDRAIRKIPTRPNPLSTMSDYTSWASLTDRAWDSRHLPAGEDRPLPRAEAVAALFNRDGETIPCAKSTVLFPYFAEWFVDGFLRSERPYPDPATGEVRRDPARNESNHEIDLIQIYGLNAEVTHQLRAGEHGLLLSRELGGEEYPPYLYDGDRKRFDKVTVVRAEQITDDQRRQLFAFGSDTGNLQLGFVLMGVLFLREHNRIARELEREYGWDDERLFQTARNILTVILIKIVVEEYINHISPYHLKLLADPTGFRNPRWYRQNWMSIEFNLLYRWHSLVPSRFVVGGREVAVQDTLFNTDLVVEHGLGACLEDASRQRAGRVGLRNSPPEVWDAELGERASGAGRAAGAVQRVPPPRPLPARQALRGRVERPAGTGRTARAVRQRRRDRALPGPVRRGRAAQRRAPAADRPHGGDRRVLTGLHQPAALPARVQPWHVLTPRLGADPLHQHALGPAPPQRARRPALRGHDDSAGLGESVRAALDETWSGLRLVIRLRER